MLLGLGDIYINDAYVGALKGTVNFTAAVEYAYGRPGNMIADSRADRISEEAMIEAEICDFKLSQLRTALGITGALVDESANIRKREQLTLASTTAKTTAQTMIAASQVVSKLDRSIIYTSGTDYSVGTTTVARKTGGAITDGQTILIEYNFADTDAKALKLGGELLTPATFRLDFTHEMEDGKTVQIQFYKALANTDFSLVFSERSSGTYTVHGMRFKALADLTKPQGNQLFRIIEEGAAA
jgi:hypothetical protein